MLAPYKQEVARSSQAPPISRVMERLAREPQAEASRERCLEEFLRRLLRDQLQAHLLALHAGARRAGARRRTPKTGR